MFSPEVLALSVRDACASLAIGKSKLYALIAAGRIEARSLGGRTIIPTSSLREFVESLPPAPIQTKSVAGRGVR